MKSLGLIPKITESTTNNKTCVDHIYTNIRHVESGVAETYYSHHKIVWAAITSTEIPSDFDSDEEFFHAQISSNHDDNDAFDASTDIESDSNSNQSEKANDDHTITIDKFGLNLGVIDHFGNVDYDADDEESLYNDEDASTKLFELDSVDSDDIALGFSALHCDLGITDCGWCEKCFGWTTDDSDVIDTDGLSFMLLLLASFF